jgi:hypothetical protein
MLRHLAWDDHGTQILPGEAMSVLTVVEDALGVQLDKTGAVGQLEDDVSDRWLENLWQALRPLGILRDDDRKAYVPERAKGGLQPYLPYRLNDNTVLDRRFVGELPAYGGLHTRKDVPRSAAGCARHLLYCDRIVLDDPIWWIVCDGIGYNNGDLPDHDRQALSARKNDILGWLAWLGAVRPLLISKRLVLLPPEMTYDAHYWGPQPPEGIEIPFDLHARTEIEKFRLEILPDSDAAMFARAGFRQAVDDMSVQMQASRFHDYRLDLCEVNAFHPFALDALLRRGEREAEQRLGSVAEGHSAKLSRLISLPAFMEIGDNPSRLVDLAANDADFASWRAGMGRALAEIAQYDSDALGFDGKVRIAFEQNLHDAVVRLASHNSQATWKGALGPAVSALGVSGIGTGAAAGIAALAGAAVAAPFALAGTALALLGCAALTYCRGGAVRGQGQAAQELYDILRGSSSH